MDIRGKRIVVIGGAGLIGSHTVDRLLLEDVGELVVPRNLDLEVRGVGPLDDGAEDALLLLI